jgi:hypothetical protein
VCLQFFHCALLVMFNPQINRNGPYLCNAKLPRQPSEPAQLRFRPCTNAKRDSGLSSQRSETLHRRY